MRIRVGEEFPCALRAEWRYAEPVAHSVDSARANERQADAADAGARPRHAAVRVGVRGRRFCGKGGSGRHLAHGSGPSGTNHQGHGRGAIGDVPKRGAGSRRLHVEGASVVEGPRNWRRLAGNAKPGGSPLSAALPRRRNRSLRLRSKRVRGEREGAVAPAGVRWMRADLAMQSGWLALSPGWNQSAKSDLRIAPDGGGRVNPEIVTKAPGKFAVRSFVPAKKSGRMAGIP